MMGTEILKIDAEMAEEIEVEVGSFNTEIDCDNFAKVCCELQLRMDEGYRNEKLTTLPWWHPYEVWVHLICKLNNNQYQFDMSFLNVVFVCDS